MLAQKAGLKILVQTYFGDVRDIYETLCSLNFDGIGLDFIEGKESLNLIKKGYLADKLLFAGLVNGKNIYKNNYAKTLNLLNEIQKFAKNVVLNTSCSLLHSPYTIKNEQKLDKKYLAHFAFAEQKLDELRELKEIAQSANYKDNVLYKNNVVLFENKSNRLQVQCDQASYHKNLFQRCFHSCFSNRTE